MFCRFFILRPAFSIVISLIILIAGVTAMWASPVEQYPNIVPPCLSISATFPGANSEAIANAVAAPLEDQLSGIQDMIYMQSTSANGSSTLTINIYFEVGENLQLVEADAINRINTAMPQLPTQVQQQGVTVRLKNPDLFLGIAFYSETGYPSTQYISNYVQRYIYPEIEQIPGIGVVVIHGQRSFAMKASLDPNKMAYYHVSTADIVNAVNDQNNQYAIGMNAMAPMSGKQKFNFLINPPGYYTNESQFQNIVIRADESNAQIVRLQDVADVKLDAQRYVTYYYELFKNKQNKVVIYPGTNLLLYLDPGANELQVKKLVSQAITETAKHLPNGIKYYYHYDSSDFVLLSIQAVVTTLLIAFALVFLVVMLFIQNIRGTIIPILAIPVSIIGTFAGTYMLGFSINTMTLFGMVLAIGIVVDDAIIVLECVERIMGEEPNLSSSEAAIKAMSEVANPIIAVVLVLNAVFLPVAFLGGFTGVLMKQFAVTIAISVFLSGIVALTLTPTLCAIFMRNMDVRHTKPQLKFFKWFNHYFDKMRQVYLIVVAWIIDRALVAIAMWFTVCILVIILFIKIPTALIPLEDMSYFYDVVQVTAAGSMDYMLTEVKQIAKKVEQLPAVNRIAILGGMDLLDNGASKTSTSSLSTILQPYEMRSASQNVDAVIKQTQEINGTNKEVTATAFNQLPIRGLSPTGGVTFYLMAKEPVTVTQIYNDSIKLVNYLQKTYPAILSAQQYYNISTPQLYVNVDPKKAYLYGVTYAQVYNTLQAIFGTYYINFFTKWNDLYWVILQGKYEYRNNPDLINTVYIKSKNGSNIPIGNLASIEYKNGPEVVTRFDDYLASQIVANPDSVHGYTQGQVMDDIREAVPKVLGKTYEIKWFGPSYQENLAGNQSKIAFSLGLVMVFLILVALYESWTLPAAVVFALPFALFGATLMLLIFSKPDDIYFQISLLTLIGLSGKNAILIVEFAIEEVRLHNATIRDAALKAAYLRFRPIIMTSIAFIFGAVPLAIATGAGANAQHSVGTGIIGGMLGSTFIATLFIPLFFILAMKASAKLATKDKTL